MREVCILGMGSSIPKEAVKFGNNTRYRITDSETQLSMAVEAAREALKNSDLEIHDIDCIVGCCAVTPQPIPNMSTLIHEQIAKGLEIPVIDINTTCTSFISALDTMSYLIEAGKYQKILIVASDVPSVALNIKQKESYELFSDAATAAVIAKDPSGKSGIIYGMQKTFSEGAHHTEIIAGGTNIIPKFYSKETAELFLFNMKGIKAIKLTIDKFPAFLKEFEEKSGEKVSFVIPHQASQALDMILPRVGLKKGSYLNIVKDYGNMVSASIPFALKYAIDNGVIKRGDNVMLLGTAAGLHINGLLLKY